MGGGRVLPAAACGTARKAERGAGKAGLPQFRQKLIALTAQKIERGGLFHREMQMQAGIALQDLNAQGAEFGG